MAELAGEYGGPEAFHRMLGWLFSVDGKFTSAAALRPGFAKAGVTEYATDIVQAISTGTLPPDKKKLFEADAREGVDLGLYYTPMAFLNGQEVKDVLRPGALRRAVDAISATGPGKGPVQMTSQHRPWSFGQRLAGGASGRTLALIWPACGSDRTQPNRSS